MSVETYRSQDVLIIMKVTAEHLCQTGITTNIINTPNDGVSFGKMQFIPPLEFHKLGELS